MLGATLFIPFLLATLGSHIPATSGSEIPPELTPSAEPPLSKEELQNLRYEAKEMFYHAYNAYMDNAFPADELMPLSCKGRWRNSEVSRGDVDEALGNFSLTLVDSLDTLVILGDLEEFERALKLVIKEVSFDTNVVVSVFETNIRMVGGLISGHILAEHVNQLYGVIGWYRGELLGMAQDLATRLLPAFNTTTGIPHPRVNLKYGMKSPKVQNSRDTCTACAGTIILEFASLSRLTGEPIFEEKARQVMDYLWEQRHRGSDLVGTVLNVHSGDWVRRDSGVGAGIDSYYEYLLKAYILLGDDGYLHRFNKHYSAVMKYVSQGPMLLDVHMHRPHTTSRNFMDALLAFWPGLQVLKGDIKPAIETHEMLYQVIQRHNFLPEAFTTDFQVHWGQHPLRPEFVESTYLLYQATGDPYYLRVGEKVLKSLQKYAFVPCGYAAVKDVRTGAHEDRMDSFVLAETFKYLYLLFTDPKDLLINLDEFIFTTEAHLLPLSLARLSNLTTVPLRENQNEAYEPDVEYARSCPNAHYLFPGRHQFAEAIRKPLKNFVSNICPTQKIMRRKLRASEFNSQNVDHVNMIRDMGITIMLLNDGRVQLLQTPSNAKTSDDAEEGQLFIQEMVEVSRVQQDQPDNPPRAVSFVKTTKSIPDGEPEQTFIIAGPAQFGLELTGEVKVTGPVLIADPIKACSQLVNAKQVNGHIVVIERGDCMFIEKARLLESLGAIGGIVIDNADGSSADSAPMFAMSGDGTSDVTIPLLFLFRADAEPFLLSADQDPLLQVTLSDYPRNDKKLEVKSKAEFIVQATGSAVKSSIKKHQGTSEVVCNGDIVSSEDAPTTFTVDKGSLHGSLWASLDAITAATNPEDLLSAAVEFISANQELEEGDEQKDEDSMTLETASTVKALKMLLLKKSIDQPIVLKELLTVYLQELIDVLKAASFNEVDLAKTVKSLSSDVFAKGRSEKSLDEHLLEVVLNTRLQQKTTDQAKGEIPFNSDLDSRVVSTHKSDLDTQSEPVGPVDHYGVNYNSMKGDSGHDRVPKDEL